MPAKQVLLDSVTFARSPTGQVATVWRVGNGFATVAHLWDVNLEKVVPGLRCEVYHRKKKVWFVCTLVAVDGDSAKVVPLDSGMLAGWPALRLRPPTDPARWVHAPTYLLVGFGPGDTEPSFHTIPRALYDQRRTELRYQVTTHPGWSGGPVIDVTENAVTHMHNGARATYNVAFPISQSFELLCMASASPHLKAEVEFPRAPFAPWDNLPLDQSAPASCQSWTPVHLRTLGFLPDEQKFLPRSVANLQVNGFYLDFVQQTGCQLPPHGGYDYIQGTLSTERRQMALYDEALNPACRPCDPFLAVEVAKAMAHYFAPLRGACRVLSVSELWLVPGSVCGPFLRRRFRNTDHFLTHGMAQYVWLWKHGWIYGVRPVWAVSSKSELMKWKKIAAGDVRTFIIGPKDYHIFCARMMQDFNVKFDALSVSEASPIGLGTCFQHGGYHRLMLEFSNFIGPHGVIVEGDLVKFDKHLLGWFYHVAMSFRIWAHDSSSMPTSEFVSRLFWCYYHMRHASILMSDGRVVELSVGNPSGSSDTAVLNTISHIFMKLYIAMLLLKLRGWFQIGLCFRLKAYADDHLEAVRSPNAADLWSFRRRSAGYALFNMRLHQDQDLVSRSVVGHTFLGMTCSRSGDHFVPLPNVQKVLCSVTRTHSPTLLLEYSRIISLLKLLTFVPDAYEGLHRYCMFVYTRLVLDGGVVEPPLSIDQSVRWFLGLEARNLSLEPLPGFAGECVVAGFCFSQHPFYARAGGPTNFGRLESFREGTLYGRPCLCCAYGRQCGSADSCFAQSWSRLSEEDWHRSFGACRSRACCRWCVQVVGQTCQVQEEVCGEEEGKEGRSAGLKRRGSGYRRPAQVGSLSRCFSLQARTAACSGPPRPQTMSQKGVPSTTLQAQATSVGYRRVGGKTYSVFRGRELVRSAADTSGAHNAGSRIFKVPLNPSYWVGTGINLQAKLYEKWIPFSLKFICQGTSPDDAIGSLIHAFDYDPTSTEWQADIGEQGLRSLERHPGAREFAVKSQARAWTTYKADPKMTDLYLDIANRDERFASAGLYLLYCLSDTQATGPDALTGFAGVEVLVEYELGFLLGNLEADTIVGSSAEARFTDTTDYGAYTIGTINAELDKGNFPVVATAVTSATNDSWTFEVTAASKGSRFYVSAVTTGGTLVGAAMNITGDASYFSGSELSILSASSTACSFDKIYEVLEDVNFESHVLDPATIVVTWPTAASVSFVGVLFIALSSDGSGNYGMLASQARHKKAIRELDLERVDSYLQKLRDIASRKAVKRFAMLERKRVDDLIRARQLERQEELDAEFERIPYDGSSGSLPAVPGATVPLIVGSAASVVSTTATAIPSRGLAPKAVYR